MFNTPILFLVFNRPETTQRVFDIIKKIKPSHLYIAADGPRKGIEEDVEKCREVRQIVGNIDWECNLNVLFRDENLGCGKSVNTAVDWFFDNVEHGIILEDDCLPELSFFNFCEKTLKYYSEEERIKMICGSNYLFNRFGDNDSFFFSNFCLIWGWATWKRVWKDFRSNYDFFQLTNVREMLSLKFEDRNLISWYQLMYDDVAHHKIGTWDIQFAYYIYSKNGLSIVPFKNQIKNIGFIGAHINENPDSKFFNMPTKIIDIGKLIFPQTVNQNKDADRYLEKGIIEAHGLKRPNRLIRTFNKLFKG
jgi:hypothetical protein